jgi:hypothetical protein
VKRPLQRAVTAPPVRPLAPERRASVTEPTAPSTSAAALTPAGDQRKLSLWVALPAIALLLPLFILPFFGRRRY